MIRHGGTPLGVARLGPLRRRGKRGRRPVQPVPGLVGAAEALDRRSIFVSKEAAVTWETERDCVSSWMPPVGHERTFSPILAFAKKRRKKKGQLF